MEIAKGGDQVFINTHSSVLVVDDDPEQRLFQVEKMEHQTRIDPVPWAGKTSVIYELLGGSPADLLLPRNLLIIEGQSEAELLTRVFSRFYGDRPQIQIIPAHGDTAKGRRSFAYLNDAFRTLSSSIFADRMVIYVDHQADRGQIEAFAAAYPNFAPNGQLLEAPTPSLEEAYPLPWRRNPQGMSGESKVNLAREVGDTITQAQFETEMPALFAAIHRTWDLGYA